MRSLPVRASLLVPVRPGRTFCVLVPSLYRDGRTGHPRTTACSSPAAPRPDLAPLNLPALVRAGLLARVRARTRAAVAARQGRSSGPDPLPFQGDAVIGLCHAWQALRRCARWRQVGEQNRLSLRPLTASPHTAHGHVLDPAPDSSFSSRWCSRRMERADASRWSSIQGSTAAIMSADSSLKTGQPSTTSRIRRAGSLRARRGTSRMLAVTCQQERRSVR